MESRGAVTAPNQGFKHRGEVVKVDREEAILSIFMKSTTACDGCHAKGTCTAVKVGEREGGKREGDKEGERILKVSTEDIEIYSVGDIVEVGIEYSVGFMALFVAYIIPLILFVLVIAILVGVGVDQGLAALGAFIISAFYYTMVYIFKSRFERIVHFSVRKL